MKRIMFLVLASCLMMMACNRGNSGPNAFDVEEIIVEDSVHFPAEAMEEWMYDDMASYLAVVDVPVTKNEDLRDNIIGWIASLLSPNYSGDSQDVRAMVEFDKDEFLGPTTGSPQSRQECFITMEDNTERYVTYTCDLYVYMGGAHGSTEKLGGTFLKADGTQFGFDMFKDPEALTPLIKQGLEEQYFEELLEDGELSFEEVIMEEARDSFPLPATEPWIQNDSVFFIYLAYEIAPYALGLPQCGFSYQELKDYLTEEAMPFFETKNKK